MKVGGINKFEGLGVIFILVLIDFFSKCYFFSISPREFISPVFNYGISRGIFAPLEIILLISLFAIGFFLYVFIRKFDKFSKFEVWGLIFLLGGSLGNFLDRILLGGVRDFIDFKFFPVFNLADVFISIGIFLLLLEIFYRK